MNTVTSIPHRKLIDINSSVFLTLSLDADRKKISLKKYIEDMLEERAREIDAEGKGFSPAILRLIGSALPASGSVEDIDDDRLQYLLSK